MRALMAGLLCVLAGILAGENLARAADEKAPAPMKLRQLLDTEEDVRKRWKKAYGVVGYDAKTKVLTIQNSGFNMGEFSYQARWEKVEMELFIRKLGNQSGKFQFQVMVNEQTVEVEAAMKQGRYSVGFIVGKNNKLGVSVNGVVRDTGLTVKPDSLKLEMKSRSEIPEFVMQVGKVMVKGEEEAATVLVEKAAPKPKGGAKVFPLLETADDFNKRWLKGNGTVDYDAKTKSARIDKMDRSYEAGGFKYDGAWEEVEFDVVVERFENDFVFNAVTVGNPQEMTSPYDFNLRGLVKGPGRYRIRVTLTDAKTLRVFVGGVQAGEAGFVLDEKVMTPLRIFFRSRAKGLIGIANVKVKGEAELEKDDPNTK